MTNDEGLEPYELFRFRSAMNEILGMYFDVPKMKDHAEFLQNKLVIERKCSESLSMFESLMADRDRLRKLIIKPDPSPPAEEKPLLFYPPITMK